MVRLQRTMQLLQLCFCPGEPVCAWPYAVDHRQPGSHHHHALSAVHDLSHVEKRKKRGKGGGEGEEERKKGGEEKGISCVHFFLFFSLFLFLCLTCVHDSKRDIVSSFIVM